MTWNDPATPFGETLIWPSGLKGEVATQKTFWETIQGMSSGCKHSQYWPMVVRVQGLGSLSESGLGWKADKSEMILKSAERVGDRADLHLLFHDRNRLDLQRPRSQ